MAWWCCGGGVFGGFSAFDFHLCLLCIIHTKLIFTTPVSVWTPFSFLCVLSWAQMACIRYGAQANADVGRRNCNM